MDSGNDLVAQYHQMEDEVGYREPMRTNYLDRLIPAQEEGLLRDLSFPPLLFRGPQQGSARSIVGSRWCPQVCHPCFIITLLVVCLPATLLAFVLLVIMVQKS